MYSCKPYSRNTCIRRHVSYTAPPQHLCWLYNCTPFPGRCHKRLLWILDNLIIIGACQRCPETPDCCTPVQACSICMDAALEVSISICRHGLCRQCAYQLCARGLAAPLCPFCRGPIQRFEAMPRLQPPP